MPYWRISGFYLFYFASLGALIPYWGLYLKELGFHATEIGSLMALMMVTSGLSARGNVTSALAGPPGEIWFGSELGVSILEVASGNWLYQDHDPLDPGSLGQGSVQSFIRDDGGVL